jgi:hypothetical protein
MTFSQLHFFERAEPLAGFFQRFFGGVFLVKGLPLVGQLGFLTCLAGALACSTAAWKGSQRSRLPAYFFSLGAFFFLCLFTVQPWDELFINLKHSQNFADHGTFSFSSTHRIEGTVDFLPYWVLGVLQKAGIDALSSAFALSFLGGLACLFFAHRIFQAVSPTPRAAPFFFLALALFPPLAFNSAHGFTSAPFAAVLLAATYSLYFSRRHRIGLGLLSVLALIRIEGAFYAIQLLFWPRKVLPWKGLRWCLALIAVLIPACTHAFFRHAYFGEAIPLPIQYKSCFGNLFFTAVGVRNFFADLVSTHSMTMLLACAVCLWGQERFPRSKESRTGALIFFAFFCSIVPYYLSGGDWFPSYWARYFLPFALILFVFTFKILTEFWLEPKQSKPVLLIPLGFFLCASLWPISSVHKAFEVLFTHRRTLAMIEEPTIGRGHYRIQHLSQLGRLIGESSRPSDRIGSSEIATLHYFAQRNAVDFLGLTNRRIAQGPLRSGPSLFRTFPYRSELPFLIFRREVPDLLESDLPEFLYTFDFMLRDQLKEVRPYELNASTLIKALHRWETQMGGLVDSLYGGLAHIESKGYVPIVVRAGHSFVGLYFVHTTIKNAHFEKLRELGFRGGRIKNTHLVEPSSIETADPQ